MIGFMISFIAPMPAGDAAQIVVHPPVGTMHFRLLRRADATPVSEVDPAAVLVYAGTDVAPIDTDVRNGQTWHYEVFHFDGVEWRPGGHPGIVVVASTFSSPTDPVLLLRERLWLGLGAMVAQGKLTARKKDGTEASHIPVLLGPPVFDETPIPVVTIQLMSSAPTERGIGDDLLYEEQIGDAAWSCGTGWLERTSFRIVGWSLNVDERSLLRHHMKSILLSNLPIFYGAGFDMIDVNASHAEDFERYGAPMYQAIVDFSALIPFGARWIDSWSIEQVDVSSEEY